MEWLLWLVAGVAGLSAAYVMTMNWIIVGTACFTKFRRTSSWVPLVGGVLGAISMLCIPIDGVAKWAWIPLIADWGTVPGLSYTAIWYLLGKHKTESKV